MWIQFDRGPDGAPAAFDSPRKIIEAHTPDEVPAALDALVSVDGWLAGYCSYELGYALEPKLLPLMPEGRKLPLLRFGVYDSPIEGRAFEGQGHLADITPVWSAGDHAAAISKVRDYIGAGDIYQANLTFPITAKATGTPEGLYHSLMQRQAVGHGALVLQDDCPAILSRSPELFFRTDGGMIETVPMKGTQPRGATPEEDAAIVEWLRNDEKNRAENLMIVDLLRNDISRVSKPGSVHVPDLFRVNTFATVHQMVSRVKAELMPDMGLADILRALFPCGSITGAPKVRAMEIIHELEVGARDIYCGTIGWWAPDGRSEFNVAIRTVMLDGQQAKLNVGGGVVWDSTAASEYEESLWKARFAELPPMTAD